MKKMILFVSMCFFLFSEISFSNNKTDKLEYIFIQEAASGELIKINDSTFQLELNNLNPFVTYFYNGPKKIAGFMPLTKHLRLLDRELKENGKHKLNAALVGIESDSDQLSDYIFSISYPSFNDHKQSISYQAQLMLNEKSKPLPSAAHFQHVMLFIDDVCVSCGAGGF